MSIELEPQYQLEVEKAQREARAALDRARLIVQRSRALLLGQSSDPDTGTATVADDTLIQVEVIDDGAADVDVPPPVLPRRRLDRWEMFEAANAEEAIMRASRCASDDRVELWFEAGRLAVFQPRRRR